MRLVILAALGYLIGCIPFAVWFAKLWGTRNLHERGSGNAGASNVLRTTGKLAALCTALCDFAKGFFPLLLLPSPTLAAQTVLLSAILLGHTFPVQFRFRGGKGMASAAGAVSAIFPLAAPFGLVVFVAILAISRRASLASLGTAWSLPLYFLFLRRYLPSVLSPNYLWLLLALALFLTWSHRSNVRLLLQGREKPLWS